MPYRYVLSPVGMYTLIDPNSRAAERVICPRVRIHIDPARNKRYDMHVQYGGDGWALMLVGGIDFAPIDADREISNLFEADFTNVDDALTMTPTQFGWGETRLNRMRHRLIERGANVLGLTSDSPLGMWVNAYPAVG